MNALVSYRSLETITPDIGPVSIGGSWDILVDGDRSQTSTLIVERASASPICTAAGNGESCIPEYGDITTRSFTQYYLDNTTVAFRGCGEVSMCTSSWSIIPSLPADTVPLALDDFGPSWLPLPGSAIRTIGLATNVEMVHDAASSTALIHLRGTISPAEVITDALTPRFGQALAAAVVTPAEEEFYSANPAQLDVWVDGET